jgi:hypothetical protein
VFGFPGKSVFLLVVALVLTSLQCVALCSAKSCTNGAVSKAPPPCHHREPAKNVPATCSHELILADTAQAPIVHAFTSDTSTESIFPRINSAPIAIRITEVAEQGFPPGLSAIASTVLRI